MFIYWVEGTVLKKYNQICWHIYTKHFKSQLINLEWKDMTQLLRTWAELNLCQACFYVTPRIFNFDLCKVWQYTFMRTWSSLACFNVMISGRNLCLRNNFMCISGKLLEWKAFEPVLSSRGWLQTLEPLSDHCRITTCVWDSLILCSQSILVCHNTLPYFDRYSSQEYHGGPHPWSILKNEAAIAFAT